MLDHILTVSAMAQHTGWPKELVIKTKTMKTKAALFDLIIFPFFDSVFILQSAAKTGPALRDGGC